MRNAARKITVKPPPPKKRRKDMCNLLLLCDLATAFQSNVKNNRLQKAFK